MMSEVTAVGRLTLLAVSSLFVVGGNTSLDFEVGGGLAVELAAGSGLGQRRVTAGGRLAGLQLRTKHTGSQRAPPDLQHAI